MMQERIADIVFVIQGIAINMRIRCLQKGHISVRNALFPIFIIVCISTTVNVGFVSACQLCLRNIVGVTNVATTSSSRHFITLEPFPTDKIHYLETRGRSVLNKEEYGEKSFALLHRKRRSQQPLFMMLNHESSNNETTSVPCDTGIGNIDTRTLETENNQTDFDAVKFFDELQRSGGMDNNIDTSDDQVENAMSVMMIGAIGFYKKVISPALPPACRFVPTCSSYGVQAIQEFGPTKGLILIAWRILRCTPVGGKGYDPPKWPPVFYTYSSY